MMIIGLHGTYFGFEYGLSVFSVYVVKYCGAYYESVNLIPKTFKL